jgi:hypothetical protein
MIEEPSTRNDSWREIRYVAPWCVTVRLLSGCNVLPLFFLFKIYSQSVRDTDIPFIIRVCEAYGRFALHKEALFPTEDCSL